MNATDTDTAGLLQDRHSGAIAGFGGDGTRNDEILLNSRGGGLPDYAELHCLSAFSFQRGASTARELFERAKRLGYRALAITDEASLAGIVRALEASRKTGVRLIVGSEVQIGKVDEHPHGTTTRKARGRMR